MPDIPPPDSPHWKEMTAIRADSPAALAVGLQPMLDMVSRKHAAGDEELRVRWWRQFLTATAAIAAAEVGPDNAVDVMRMATEETGKLVEEFKAARKGAH